MIEDELYIVADTTWDTTLQEDALIEECSELITAIVHKRRNKTELRDVIEEMADVQLMINQMIVTYNAGLMFESMKQQKLWKFERVLKEYNRKGGW